MATSGDNISWASHASKGCVKRLNKNVMEIVLEKDTKGVFNASDNEAAKVLQKLGVDVSNHVEMVQICPVGKNVIQVTLKDGVNMDRFFAKEVFEVKPGLRVSHVRSAGQREVTVLIKGLHPQTPDSKVFEYLRCMGNVKKTKVIFDVYKEGPLKGLQNGDRRYFVEFSQNISVGALHIVDGHKVTFSFSGQRRSCFRCLKVSNECPGNGIAKDCEAAGSPRKLLAVHMQEFWDKINFCPSEVPIPNDLDDHQEEIEQQIGGSFTPNKKQNSSVNDGGKVRKCGALSIKWFPKKADHGEIMQFLVNLGLPKGHEGLQIKDNGQVIVENLDSTLCEKLCDSVTGSKFMGKKTIYCQGIVLATPDKSTTDRGGLNQTEHRTDLQGKKNKSVSKTPQTNSSLNDFVFADVNNSKFFAASHETESESDNLDDSYANEVDQWLKGDSRKRRKQKLKNKSTAKKLDRRATP